MSELQATDAPKPTGQWGAQKPNLASNAVPVAQAAHTNNTQSNERKQHSTESKPHKQHKQNNKQHTNDAAAQNTDTTAPTSETGDAQPPKREKKVYDTPYQPVEKTDKPNEAEFKKQKSALENKHASIKLKIDALTTQINELSVQRNTVRADRQPLLDQIKAIRAQKNLLFDQAKQYDAQIQAVRGTETAAQKKLNDMKKELEFTDVIELDKYIQHVENTLSTTTVPYNQEKLLIEKIRKLKGQREQIIQYNNQLSAIGSKQDTTVWEAERKRLNKEANVYKEQELQLQAQLTNIHDNSDNVNSNVESLIQQRKDLHTEKNELFDQIKQLERNFKQQTYLYTRWIKQEEYEKQKQQREEQRAKQQAEYEQRKKKREEYEQRKAERQAAYEEQKRQQAEYEAEQAKVREQEEANRDVWEQEKYIADELVKYLYTLAPAGTVQQDTTDNDTTTEHSDVDKLAIALERANAFKGDKSAPLVAFSKKDDNPFGSVATKKKGAKPAAKPNTKKTTAVLSHKPEIFIWFQTIDIDPPHTTAAVPTVIDKVKQKREWYNTAPRHLKTGKKASTTENHTNGDNLTATNIGNDQDGASHQHTSNSADVGGAGDVTTYETSEGIHARVEKTQAGEDLSVVQ